MDELMFADDDDNRQKYYQEIIDSVIEFKIAKTLITEIANTIV